MSRIIVKNLPKRITEEKLRSIFQQKGTLTDIQLKYTADGKFREFAFIGYQNESEAQQAITDLNNTFIHTKKVTVQSCTSLGDSTKPKSWSKYATDSTAFKKSHNAETEQDEEAKKDKKENKKQDVTAELLREYKDDPMFLEFLEVHAPEHHKKLKELIKSEQEKHEEDEDAESSNAEESEDDAEEPEDKVANQDISDLDYMKKLMQKKETNKKEPKHFDLFTAKLKGLPYNCKKKDVKQFLKPLTPFSIRRPLKIPGIAYVGFKTEKDFKKALLKDRSFYAGKRISVAQYSGKSQLEDENKTKKNQKWISQEEALKNEEDIAESGKLFIRNLAYTTNEDEINELFNKYGPLAEVNLPIDPVSKKIKGFGTVTFVMPEHAVKAYGDLDGGVLHGRMLHLLPGKNKDTENEVDEESTNFKKKKQAKQKSEAGSSHNWNSLFLGHDAVAEVIADTYNTSKEKVLGPHGDGSAAVRLALGETQIVAQTRKYLEQEGVVLDAFNTPAQKRSKTIILVKNLPTKTDAKEMRDLFAKFGLLGRVILPPSGITALIEFLEPTEARKAFTCLAYTKFKNVPLYLEWAPENSLTSKTSKQENKSQENKEKPSTNLNEQNNIEEEEIEEEAEPDTTIFVKNLNFQTTDDVLRKHFEGCGKICYANVATKKDAKDPSRRLSMGYGFVRFMLKKDADKALKSLQQSILDGKSVELKRSERTLNNDVRTSKKTSTKTKQTGSKILVRNIPFQASIKEIRELFSVFGEIKALRLPKKMSLEDGSHRGFGFVDFVTQADAKSAFEALSQSTHLYGRRLVLEWAAAEEGVDDIRKRTAKQFQVSDPKRSRKSVLSVEEKE